MIRVPEQFAPRFFYHLFPHLAFIESRIGSKIGTQEQHPGRFAYHQLPGVAICQVFQPGGSCARKNCITAGVKIASIAVLRHGIFPAGVGAKDRVV